ncbi:hypothetical protein HBB16_20870, partial [Pseudonocardia sp. MCCB 268]|nr:hypothetical protein [Pseudonocardia cytotoxica]
HCNFVQIYVLLRLNRRLQKRNRQHLRAYRAPGHGAGGRLLRLRQGLPRASSPTQASRSPRPPPRSSPARQAPQASQPRTSRAAGGRPAARRAPAAKTQRRFTTDPVVRSLRVVREGARS